LGIAWTSHSVLVIDMSGSMRRDNVNGARCRSDGVWMVLARDYIKSLLEKNVRSPTDLISVIVMRDRAELVMAFEPTDWVLYNMILDMREWTKIRPHGPGNYMPALELAEQTLLKNAEAGSFALSLLFFSDGKPSDRGDFAERMGGIASKFGRRLTLLCVGMAEEGEDFSTLYNMVDEAKAYGVVASFGKPSLDADSLSNIITSLASSLTASKTEMTDLGTGKSKTLRTDVTFEKRNIPDDTFLTADWYVYRENGMQGFFEWSYTNNDFVMVMDTRCFSCWTLLKEDSVKYKCIGCQTALFCSKKCNQGDRNHDCAYMRKEKRKGISRTTMPSYAVAMKKSVFSEGAERMVYKFRFLDSSDHFTGPKMVAKESRFVDVNTDYENRLSYHREFMRTQAIASKMALKFNEALDFLLKGCKRSDRSRAYFTALPRINFLSPQLVHVTDGLLGDLVFLIEPMLDVGKYEKFNNNMGYVKGQKQLLPDSKDIHNFGSEAETVGKVRGEDLGVIEEGSEDEDEEEEEDDDLLHTTSESNPDVDVSTFDLRAEDFPSAFSHFSYQMSKGKLMVVDLQGVFTVRGNTSVYELTDPVIHKKKKTFKHWSFGRTDRGQKGMNAFFHTHVCTDACQLFGLTKHRLHPKSGSDHVGEYAYEYKWDGPDAA